MTPAFDLVVRIAARERMIKRRLLDEATSGGTNHVLDLGAGTGTLAIWLKQRFPDARVTALDADPDILALARRKAAAAQCDVDFVEGFSTELPFPEASFDLVLSTYFFHHLTGIDKRQTLREVERVLEPGGRLHVVDLGKPSDPVMSAFAFGARVFDGFEVTRDNLRGALPALFEQAGLADASENERFRTAMGTVALYSARKPAIA